jgi:GNAT superfamily N-acetyltransferase
MGTGASLPRSPHAGTPEHNAEERLLLRDGTVVWLRTMDLDHERFGERAGIAADIEGGRTVGRVCYRRVYGLRAEMQLEVDDAYWHRGVPELLLARLCVLATCTGISTFLARMPAYDGRLLTLLREAFGARESRDGAYVEIELSTTAPRAIRADDPPRRAAVTDAP